MYLRNYNHTFLTWSCLCSLVGIVVIMQIKDIIIMVIEQVLKWPIDHRFDMILLQDVVTVINLIFPPFVWVRWILLPNKRRKKTEVGIQPKKKRKEKKRKRKRKQRWGRERERRQRWSTNLLLNTNGSPIKG